MVKPINLQALSLTTLGRKRLGFYFFLYWQNNTFLTNMYTQTKRAVQLLNPRDTGSPKLRMVSWNLNTLLFGGDWTSQSYSDVRWARIPKVSRNFEMFGHFEGWLRFRVCHSHLKQPQKIGETLHHQGTCYPSYLGLIFPCDKVLMVDPAIPLYKKQFSFQMRFHKVAHWHGGLIYPMW